MRAALARWQALEFQARIFISFGIVAAVAGFSFPGSRSAGSIIVLVGRLLDAEPGTSLRIGYVFVALAMLVVSVTRMWAGSILSSGRMMAFRVRKDELVQCGPYRLVRHPIYLADFVAFFGFALCLRPWGAMLPLLLYLHYTVLTHYEERVLRAAYGGRYAAYAAGVPRFLPGRRSWRHLPEAWRELRITVDGARHNALYVLFVPGFLVSAWTLSLLPALLIGLPAVLDWAIVHTIKGVQPDRPTSCSPRPPAPERRACPSAAPSSRG